MPLRGWSHLAYRCLIIYLLVTVLGCEAGSRPLWSPSAGIPARRAESVASARLAQDREPTVEPPPVVPARPSGPATTQPAITFEQLLTHIPDPVEELERIARELARAELLGPERVEYERLQERIERIHRPQAVRLTLSDAIRRALQNNYRIQLASYNPAIQATQIVEAEAAFDAVFFANFLNDKQDRPSPSQLAATASQARNVESGIRKLLSTGAQMSISYALTRTETNLVFQTLNPSYSNSFIVEFRQPFLRGFGLDYNRSQIELRRLDRDVNVEQLRSEIQDRIFDVERYYWMVVQSRRGVVISARVLTSLERILHWLEQRLEVGYDVYGVQLELTRSRLQNEKAEFIRLCNVLRSNEDLLKSAMNDPELNLSRPIEIIPTDVPILEPVMLDECGEAAEALKYRPDLRVARLDIERSEIGVGVAKNQAMPRLDGLLRYIVDGIGPNADRAFSQLSENDFHEYVVGIEFEWPIGSRAGEAALKRACLQRAAAIAQHRSAIEAAILQVITTVRDIQSYYEQISPRFEAVAAAQNHVRATVARKTRQDPPSLQLELDAYDTLGNARRTLLSALVTDPAGNGGYTVRLADLERVKGTLLRYNNIVIRGADDETYLDPYRPIGP